MKQTTTKAFRRMGRMARSSWRRARRPLLITVFLTAAFVAAVQVAAPMLISITVVRRAMEQAVAEWTGHDVTIDGPPSITFWPQPRIEVTRLTISKPTSTGPRVLGRAGKLSANFSLFQSILGHPTFDDFHLVDPEVFIVRDKNGRLDWANDGLLSAAVRNVSAPDASTQALDRSLDASIGDITIENGRIELTDRASGQVWRMTAISADLDWPRLSREASVEGNAHFNGQTLRFSLSSSQPLLLLSGRSAPLAGNVNSNLLSVRLAGHASLSNYAYISGDLALAVPDLSALFAWSGIDFSGAKTLKQLDLSAHVLTETDTLRFDKLRFSLNGAEANGVMDLALPSQAPPRITGTLAFDRVDFASIIAALSTHSPGPAAKTPPRSGMEFDMRISAQETSLGPFSLGRTALSIMSTSGRARVDIVDSEVENGRLTGQILAAEGGFDSGASFDLSVRDANLQALFQHLGMEGLPLAARGTIELSFDVDKPPLDMAWRDVEGSIRLTTGAGTLAGLDPATIRQRSEGQSSFPLRNPGGEDFNYRSLELAATFNKGTAEIQSARIAGENIEVLVSGLIPFDRVGLALSTRLMQPGQTGPDQVFFIGGSWPDLVALPVSQDEALSPLSNRD